MPTGEADPPRTHPAHYVVCEPACRLEPQCEVRGTTFFGILVYLVACSGNLFVKRLSGELCIVWERGHVEVDCLTGLIGVTALHELLNQCNHFRHVLSCPALHGRSLDIEGLKVSEEYLFVVARDVPDALARFVCLKLHLVIAGIFVRGQVPHVGNIHNHWHFIPEVLKCSSEDVRKYVGTQVADVCVVVDCRPARVHPHFLRIERCELLPAFC